jgi:hypothetical protein
MMMYLWDHIPRDEFEPKGSQNDRADPHDRFERGA